MLPLRQRLESHPMTHLTALINETRKMMAPELALSSAKKRFSKASLVDHLVSLAVKFPHIRKVKALVVPKKAPAPKPKPKAKKDDMKDIEAGFDAGIAAKPRGRPVGSKNKKKRETESERRARVKATETPAEKKARIARSFASDAARTQRLLKQGRDIMAARKAA